MRSTRRVTVGAPPLAATGGWAVVVVDVLRATTVLCTAAALGRSCLVAATVEEARALVGAVPGALLAGEQGGRVPDGFDLGNSPAEVARRADVHRPMVLVTSSGTPRLRAADGAPAVFAACLRNLTAQIRCLAEEEWDVAVVPAGTHGRRRDEDDLCAAYLASGLLRKGFSGGPATLAHVSIWADRPVTACAEGRSAEFLRGIGREEDVTFVLEHVDDLAAVFPLTGARLDRIPVP